jgi:hypothetical protein
VLAMMAMTTRLIIATIMMFLMLVSLVIALDVGLIMYYEWQLLLQMLAVIW